MNQREIASALGVSQTTVSLVLNNPKTKKISTQTRGLILDFLRDNSYDSALSTQGTGNIAYLLPISVTSEAHLPFYDRFILGIQAASSENGYNIILEKYQDAESLLLPQKKADGIIVEGRVDLHRLRELTHCLPLVLLNYSFSSSICDMISPDNAGGIQLALDYLYKQGHRRIGFFAAAPSLPTQESNYIQRLHAFKSWIQAKEVVHDDSYVQSPSLNAATTSASEEAVGRSLQFWLKMKQPPTAVLCGNDLYAFQMIRQAHLLGLTVPQELSIVGMDNVPSSQFSFPSLTTIDHNAEEMGRLSVETLLERIQNPDRPTRRISCNASLIIRESVADLAAKTSYLHGPVRT